MEWNYKNIYSIRKTVLSLICDFHKSNQNTEVLFLFMLKVSFFY